MGEVGLCKQVLAPVSTSAPMVCIHNIPHAHGQKRHYKLNDNNKPWCFKTIKRVHLPGRGVMVGGGREGSAVGWSVHCIEFLNSSHLSTFGMFCNLPR